MLRLKIFSKTLTFLGLFFVKSSANFNDGFKKCSVINMLVLLSLYFATLSNLLEKSRELLKVVTLSLDSCICFVIYLRRYTHVGRMKNFVLLLTRVSDWNNGNQGDNRKFGCILKHLPVIFGLSGLLLLVISNILCTYYYEQHQFQYCYLEAHILLIFITELEVTSLFLSLYRKTFLRIEADLKQSYEDFYKIPVAECRKLENGDFMVTGWINEVLYCRNSEENAVRIQEIAPKVIVLVESWRHFWKVFNTSPKLIVFSLLAHLTSFIIKLVVFKQPPSHYMVFINAVYLTIPIVKIWSSSCSVHNRILQLGLTSYKLFLDLPARTFLIEENLIKSTFLFLYKYCYYSTDE